jgi:hypothetical protein
MAETKRFPLRDILSVTTGRLLTKANGPHDNGIDAIYKLLGWMTNDSPFTHQLPRFAEECKPWLLRWFPELTQVNGELGNAVNGLDWWISGSLMTGHTAELAVSGWLSRVQADCGLQEFYDVPRIPQDDHERKHPYDELVAMRGTDEGVIVVDLEKGGKKP